MPNPILELDNVSIINPNMHLPTAVAALPDGEAIVYFTETIVGVLNHYIHRVVKINRHGEVLHNTEHTVSDSDTRETCRGLLVSGEMLYIVKKTNSSVERIRLSEFEKGFKEQIDEFHIPDAEDVVNFASLYYNPSKIPDKDLLLLADRGKYEIFTYKLSSKEKKVRIKDKYLKTRHNRIMSVSYIIDNNKIFYLVCGGYKVMIYNSEWKLVKTFADFNDSALNYRPSSMPASAIVLPDGNVIIADSIRSRVSEYIINGTLKQHLLTTDDKIYKPVYLTFSYPHLWVLGYSTHKNILNRYRLYED